MTIFDLLFIVLVLTSAATLMTALVAAFRGQGRRSLRIVARLGVCAAVYVTVVAVVALFAPQRVIAVGDSWCFDDWCLSVQKVTRTAAADRASYRVSLVISSRARRVSQRAKGAWIYLIDGRGNRYAPEPDSAEIPLDTRLAPGEAVKTSRVFNLPADARQIGLVTGHGPCCIATFIIGDPGSLFHKRTYIRLD